MRFSSDVGRHTILLRCQPMENSAQHLVDEHLIMPPQFSIHESSDVFGNRIVYGSTDDRHQKLSYISAGIAEENPYALPPDGLETLCAYPSPLTSPSENLQRYASELFKDGNAMSASELSEYICNEIHGSMQYIRGVTSPETTAAQAFDSKQGVCQDYAHIMIALCRLCHIPARYVCGFMCGLYGETHAWVETFDGQAWHAYDPTNGTRAQEGYIKVAQGRDAADCPVARGIVKAAGVMQSTHISVSVEELC